jgi:hypothetical protein
MNHLIAYYGTRLQMAEKLGMPYYKLNAILNDEPRKLVVHFPLIMKQTKLSIQELWDIVGKEITESELPSKIGSIHDVAPEIMKISGMSISELIVQFSKYGN